MAGFTVFKGKIAVGHELSVQSDRAPSLPGCGNDHDKGNDIGVVCDATIIRAHAWDLFACSRSWLCRSTSNGS